MRALLALASIAILAAAAACAPATTSDDGFRSDPQADKGDIVFTVTAAEPQVVLGGDIVLTCRVANKGSLVAHVNEPRLSTDSVSFKVRTDTVDTAWIERIRIREAAYLRDVSTDPPVAKDLKPGEFVESQIHVTAVLVGKWSIMPIYRCGSLVGGPLSASLLTVEVTPDGANDRLAIRYETTLGTITAMLRPELAFNTCEAHASLARHHYFDGMPFHRAIQGFMAQTGAPGGLGWKGPGFQIRQEKHPQMRHRRGIFAMARSDSPDSAGSQFYVCFDARPMLDDMGFVTFAEMIDGEDTLRKMEAASAGPNEDGPPKRPFSLKTVSLFTTTAKQ